MSNNITTELELALRRIQSLEASLTYIRGSLVEFAKPPYRDSDLASLFQWINARASRLIQAIDLMSDNLKRLYPVSQDALYPGHNKYACCNGISYIPRTPELESGDSQYFCGSCGGKLVLISRI